MTVVSDSFAISFLTN